MTELTRPERAAQIRQAKRYRAAIRKKGICSACIHRDQTFGVFHCRNKPDRSGTNCETTPGPGFTFDDSVLKQFADAA